MPLLKIEKAIKWPAYTINEDTMRRNQQAVAKGDKHKQGRDTCGCGRNMVIFLVSRFKQ